MRERKERWGTGGGKESGYSEEKMKDKKRRKEREREVREKRDKMMEETRYCVDLHCPFLLCSDGEKKYVAKRRQHTVAALAGEL